MSLRMGVVLLGVALLLAACAPTPAHDATVVSRLDDMLLDESAVNAIMGPPPLTATHTYRALEQWPAGYSYSPADCLAVSGNAMASVYQGTRSGEMRGTLFTNDQTGTEVDEAVVAFDTAAHARDFVASTAGTWQRCSDEVLTITSAGRPPRTFTIDVPGHCARDASRWRHRHRCAGHRRGTWRPGRACGQCDSRPRPDLSALTSETVGGASQAVAPRSARHSRSELVCSPCSSKSSKSQR
jgi:PknH-like extracellular domain